jgi:UDP-glucose 4-epimerase
MSTRVLVTGGAGFIGSHLVDTLIARGHDVVVLDDFSTGTRANLTKAQASGRLRILEGNVLSPEDVAGAVAGCGTIYHLAVKSVRHALGFPLENHAVNAGGTLNLLEAARRAHVARFVYCSSSEVYGNAADVTMHETTTVCRPVTVYGGSKLAGEHYTQAYHQTYGMPTVIVRPFNAYGPRAHLHGESGEVIPRFFARVLSGQAPVIFGDGRQTRDFTFVTDIATGIVRAGEVAAAIGRVVNIGFGKPASVLDLAEIIASLCGRTDLTPAFHAARPGDVQALWADVERCRTILGFAPTIELREGLRLYLNWFAALLRTEQIALADIATQNWVTA